MIENIDIFFTVLILVVYLICFLGILFYSTGIPVKVAVCCDRSNGIADQGEDRNDDMENTDVRRNGYLIDGSLISAVTYFSKIKDRLSFGNLENPSMSRRSHLLAEANLNIANDQEEKSAFEDSESESTYSVDLFQQINIDLLQ